jgi:hypothetical protein
MRLAKIGDRPKVRCIAGGQDAEGEVFGQPPLDLLTARPSGAFCSPPSPSPSAIGTMLTVAFR